MTISDLSGKRVCIVGLGREGLSTLNAIRTYAPTAHIEVRDRDPQHSIRNTPYAILHTPSSIRTGADYLSDLQNFDVIIVSPGIKPCKELEESASRLTSATQLFFDTIRGSGSTVIGVTGSKGKSTTASLIHAMLKEAGKNAFLIGNIGDPALDHLDDAGKNTFFVFELSSYQLKDVTVSPQIAVLTSFFPEHLDYHGSIDAYRAAKERIVRFQGNGDAVFYNAENEGATAIATSGKGKKTGFTAADAPVALDDTKMVGRHNLQNVAGAWKVAEALGVSKEQAVQALRDFRPLPHRLENIGVHHGVTWIDDSISTTPESAIAALDALGNDVATIILGGKDRGNDFGALAKHIANTDVTVILLGENARRIAGIFDEHRVQSIMAADMAEAVAIAKEKTPKGTIVLLSPASASYDLYKNFEERGRAFAQHCTEA